jgi:nitroreductase/NAD-dependent dihydropyrimidine dehydrogenase PreA subunit
MSLFIIDEELCIGCGTCVAACPVNIIELPDNTDYPNEVEGAAELCINCGHCMSVCEQSALTLKTMARENCGKTEWDIIPSLRQMEEIIRARRAVRVYREREVPTKLITRLINAARYAPTGKNSQMLSWMIIQDRDLLDTLVNQTIDWTKDMIEENSPLVEPLNMERVVAAYQAGDDPILHGAPALVLIHAPEDHPGGVINATIALTTFELAAFAAGLGTCWAGYLQRAAVGWPALQKTLGLPEGHVSCAAMMLGYPDIRYRLVPQRKEPRITWR